MLTPNEGQRRFSAPAYGIQEDHMDSHQAGDLTQHFPDTTLSQDNSGWKGPWVVT